MSDLTRILTALDCGESSAADELLPLVYGELRKLAAAKLRNEEPGQTLQPTALVHEAYLCLVAQEGAQVWESRGHFFSAAAEAMRRILIDRARRKSSQKQGGGRRRVALLEAETALVSRSEELLALDDALERLMIRQPQAAELVKLRFFGGLSVEDAAEAMRISARTARRKWVYARAWLRREMDRTEDATAAGM